MKKARDVDVLLDRFERDFSEKIEKLEPNSFFDEILAEKNRQINELRTLPRNREILAKLKELEEIKASLAYRLTEKAKFLLFAIPPVRWILYLFRRLF